MAKKIKNKNVEKEIKRDLSKLKMVKKLNTNVE